MIRRRKHFLAVSALSVLLFGAGIGSALPDPGRGRPAQLDRQVEVHVERLLAEGQRIFRFDTFGDEAFWGDTLELHRAIRSAGLGGVDAFQAERSPDGHYRTAPLKGLWTHTRGGFYHDGRFATLLDVVNHYEARFRLGLSDAQKNDLIEFLKSL